MTYDLPPRKASGASPRWSWVLGALIVGGIVGYVVRPTARTSADSASVPTTAVSAPLLSPGEWTALAEQLERNRLYAEAARAWEQAARQSPPQGAEKAGTLFRIGKNYSLAHQHERALGYLFAAEAADQDARWSASINKLVLEGLSALGHEDVRAHQAAKRIALQARDDDAPAPVAHVGGEPISELDLQSFARQIVTQQLAMQRQFMSAEAFEQAVASSLDRFKQPEGRQQLLQMYISQELLYREALAGGLAEHEEVRRRTIDARRQILTDAFLSDYLDRNLHIDDGDLQNAYQAKMTDYVEPEAFKVQAIVVRSEEAKDDASDALDAGTAFDEVRDTYTTLSPGADQPDPFDRWLTRDGWVPMAADSRAAMAHVVSLEAGEVGGKWLEGSDGTWLRFKLAERRPPRQLAFEECRQRVEQDLRAGKQRDLLERLQQSLQDKYEVVIQQNALQPADREPSEEKDKEGT